MLSLSRASIFRTRFKAETLHPSVLPELHIPFEKLLSSRRIEQPFIDKSLGPLNDLQIVFSFYCFLQFNSLDFQVTSAYDKLQIYSASILFRLPRPLLLYVFIKKRSRKTDSRLKEKQIEMGQMYLA